MDSRETPSAAAAASSMQQSHLLRQPTSYNYNHSPVSSQPLTGFSDYASTFMQPSRFPPNSSTPPSVDGLNSFLNSSASPTVDGLNSSLNSFVPPTTVDGLNSSLNSSAPPTVDGLNSSLNSSAPSTVDGLNSSFVDGSPNIVPDKKNKRGRPRKYSADSGTGLGLNPDPNPTEVTPFSPPDHGFSGSGKKSRGRPRGSGKKQLDSLGLSGVGFTPHVIIVHTGEDIASKIMALSQEGPHTICILSANGTVSNVTLHQPATTGGTVTYEGCFEIISLSGSFVLSESNGSSRGRTCGLSVSLAGSDGRILGGSVAGMLTAASPVQVIVGSFVFPEGKKPKTEMKAEVCSTPFPTPPSQSQGGSSISSDENGGGPFNQGATTTFVNSSSHHQQLQQQHHHNMGLYSNMGWGK